MGSKKLPEARPFHTVESWPLRTLFCEVCDRRSSKDPDYWKIGLSRLVTNTRFLWFTHRSPSEESKMVSAQLHFLCLLTLYLVSTECVCRLFPDILIMKWTVITNILKGGLYKLYRKMWCFLSWDVSSEVTPRPVIVHWLKGVLYSQLLEANKPPNSKA